MFVILLFKLLSLFSLSLSSLCSLSQSSLFSLSTNPSFSSESILCPPKIKTSRFIINGTYFCILFHTMTYLLNNAFYKLVKTKFWCFSANLSYPEDLKKQWLHRRVGSRKFYKRPSFSSNFRFALFSIILSLLPFSILSLLPFLISPSPSTIPSCSSDQFFVLLG